MKRKLTPKQQKFADEYIKSGNAADAARKAGYSKQTARTVGQQNLTKLDIKEYIDEHMAEIASKRIMDATEAVELLTSIARGETKETVYISAVDGVHECSQKAMPRRDPLYGAYTADELVALIYGRYAPNLAPLSLKEWEVEEIDNYEGWHCKRV